MRATAAAAGASLLVLMGWLPSPGLAQTRTAWQRHPGLEVTDGNPHGHVAFVCLPAGRGDACEFDDAEIPPEDDEGWQPAPHADDIGFSSPSNVCEAPVTCAEYGDFTYYQTLVDIPWDYEISKFTIAFAGIDDATRVTVFNSDHPDGFVVPESYVSLGGKGTANLTSLVVPGEVNRVVVTQVDDCCSANLLVSAVVVLEGRSSGEGE